MCHRILIYGLNPLGHGTFTGSLFESVEAVKSGLNIKLMQVTYLLNLLINFHLPGPCYQV